MKKIFKLFPVALAVLALASCSDNDLFSSESGKAVADEGDLVISCDPFEEDGVAVTRGMRTAVPSSLNFEEDDSVNIYDQDLYKHDLYTYEPGSPKGKFNVVAPQRITTGSEYALYPSRSVVRGYWDRESDKVIAEFAIDPIVKYDAKSETKIGDDFYYSYELPSAGKASWNASANRVDVSNFRALTGILQLNLEDALYNANWIRVSSSKPLSGTFKVVLDKDNWSAIQLEKGAADLFTDNAIYIDMRQVPSRVSCVYLPIIAGIDTNVDGLKVEISMESGDNPYIIPESSSSAPNKWYDTGLMFPNKVIKPNAIYRGTKKFDLLDMNPVKISQMLEQYKGSQTDIDLVLADKFTIDASDDEVGNVIELPQFDNSINVSITLGDNFTTWTNSNNDDLVFADVNDDVPFQGTVTLNVVDKFPVGGDNSAIGINLEEGNAVLAGDFSNFIVSSSDDLTLTSAGTVKLGDGKTTTTIEASDLTLGEVALLEVAPEATVTNDVTTTAVNTSVTINGKLDGGIDMTKSVKNGALLRIHGREANASATPAITAKAAEVTGDVTTMCNVTIDLTTEGVAIATKLTLNGYDNTLTLVQGYVTEFDAQVTNTGSWEESKVNVVLNSANEGLAAFKTINALNDANGELTAIEFTESLWNGGITNTTDFGSWSNMTTSYQENSTEITPKGIFTASQLASLTNIDMGRVLNNINMNGTAAAAKGKYVGFALSGNFKGTLPAKDAEPAAEDIHTISNLDLTKAGTTGLIKTLTGTATIENLNIAGVTATKAADTESGLGALLGSNSANLTVNNVKVTGINFAAASGKKLSKVGGLIGTTSTGVTLTGVTAAGTIDGYKALGGLFGELSADAAISVAKSNTEGITIAQTYNSAKEFDLEYAKIGSVIGTVSVATTGVKVTVDADTKIGTVDQSVYASKKKVVDTNSGTGNVFYFHSNQNYIGFSGAGLGAPTDYATTIGAAKLGTTTLASNYAVPTFTTTNRTNALSASPATTFATGVSALYYFSATAE